MDFAAFDLAAKGFESGVAGDGGEESGFGFAGDAPLFVVAVRVDFELLRIAPVRFAGEDGDTVLDENPDGDHAHGGDGNDGEGEGLGEFVEFEGEVGGGDESE